MAVKFEYTGKLSDGRVFDNTSTKKVIVEIDDNDLNVSELLEEFMNFLKAVGYSFDSGDYFDVVNDFKDWKNKVDDDHLNDAKDRLNIDLNNIAGTSDPAFGAVPSESILKSFGT